MTVCDTCQQPQPDTAYARTRHGPRTTCRDCAATLTGGPQPGDTPQQPHRAVTPTTWLDRPSGLDLSLTSTGVAAPDGSLHIIASKQRGIERVVDIAHNALHLIGALSVDHRGVDIVAIEGYSFSSRNSHAHALGELGGVVRYELWARGVPWVDIPPATVKKYATGKGNATKDQVLAAAIRRGGPLFTGTGNDVADAWWLRTLTLDAYNHPLIAVPQTHRAALDKIDWPEPAGQHEP